MPSGTAAEPPGRHLLDALMRRAGPTDEERRLDALCGTWEGDLTWGIVDDGHPVRYPTSLVNESILGGKAILSRTDADSEDDPSSVALYGWDAEDEQYFVVALSSLRSGFDLERGRWDDARSAFIYDAVEHVGPQREAIPFRRTVEVDGDRLRLVIDYPEHVDDPRMGGLDAQMRRVDP